jgi:UDP-N-acetylmuramoyl-tripeptide--D-alanyl-D-alanine ligase
MVLVPDVERAFDALARAARSRTRAKIVGITGSVGKTSTKEMLAAALAAQAKTHASAGNLNNQWGVPLSLARLPADAVYAVIEMGMNHAGEIAHLTDLARPDVAIITTIAAVHLENFASVYEIAEAKAEIFQSMAGGTAILNRDNAYFPVLACLASASGVARIVGFGQHGEAMARLENCTLGDAGSRIVASIGGARLEYALSIPGQQWAMNSLAVLAAVRAVGADLGRAAETLGAFAGLAGRGKRHCVLSLEGDFELIDESYNASPASVRAALDVLGRAHPRGRGRRIAVLGDMLELGAKAEAMHAALAETIAEHRIDLVFAAGPHMAALARALPPHTLGAHRASANELAPLVVAAIRAGDVVSVKGSHGMRMDRVVTVLLGTAQGASGNRRATRH